MRSLSLQTARRLVITRQRLTQPRPSTNADGILDVVRDLGSLQIDPISAVERSHLLVLWSRIGDFDTVHLDRLLWRDRSLFEYWAHAASIVLTEDYPIHQSFMRTYATGPEKSAIGRRFLKWLKDNQDLRRHIRHELRRRGPLPARAFEDKAEADWYSTGWTSGRNVSQMLDYMWTKGQIMVAGRAGGQKLWDLAERCLPDWTPRAPLPIRAVVRTAAQKSLRALGVATQRQIAQHFTRGRYPGLARVLIDLEAAGHIERVQIVEDGTAWPDTWYIHAQDIPLLDRVSDHEWASTARTTLLSPFDNLIADRKRTERLFNFKYTVEIYVPKHKREYGYYVLPILHGDRVIGRIDPLMDRKRNVLNVNAVYAEPDAPMTRKTARAIRGAIEDLATFLGADHITYGERIPEGWQRDLQ